MFEQLAARILTHDSELSGAVMPRGGSAGPHRSWYPRRGCDNRREQRREHPSTNEQVRMVERVHGHQVHEKKLTGNGSGLRKASASPTINLVKTFSFKALAAHFSRWRDKQKAGNDSPGLRRYPVPTQHWLLAYRIRTVWEWCPVLYVNGAP